MYVPTLDLASTTDLLRLLAVPVLGWAAWRDVKTRRVPNRTWLPLTALAVVLLAWDALAVWTGNPVARRLFVIQVVVSVGVVVPLAYLLWRVGGFGGADAKALMVLALLFPTYPAYYLPWASLPVHRTALGVFSLTVVTNAVLLGAAYPVALLVRNALAGRFSTAMAVARPVPWDRVDRTYGRLFAAGDGPDLGGLDLDALRMYLTWRDASLDRLRADPRTHRDPDSLPSAPRPPGDGAVTDGGVGAVGGVDDRDRRDTAGTDGPRATRSASPGPAAAVADVRAEAADPWGAEAFLESIDGTAYGTTPEQLRSGLEHLVSADEVWVSPGIPFIVPLFLGVVVGFTYGDLLFTLLGLLSVV